MLGVCPTLATTTSAMNGMMLGLATMVVLICSNIVISLIKKITPDMFGNLIVRHIVVRPEGDMPELVMLFYEE